MPRNLTEQGKRECAEALSKVLDAFWGLLAGSCAEVVRMAVLRALRRDTEA
jgi:hypothetical protein